MTKNNKIAGRGEIKGWAVVWTEEARKDFGVPIKDKIISLEPREDADDERYRAKCRCHKTGWHYLDGMAIFYRKSEAVAYRNRNGDFKVVKINIKLEG